MERTLRRLETVGLVIGGLSCGLLTILTILDIGLRPFNIRFYLASEMSGFLMAWLIFFTLPMVSRQREHIAADFLITRFSPRVRVAVDLLADILALVYVTALVFICGELTAASLADNLRSQGILRTPIAIPQIGMMVGLALLWLRHVLFLVARPHKDLGALPSASPSGANR